MAEQANIVQREGGGAEQATTIRRGGTEHATTTIHSNSRTSHNRTEQLTSSLTSRCTIGGDCPCRYDKAEANCSHHSKRSMVCRPNAYCGEHHRYVFIVWIPIIYIPFAWSDTSTISTSTQADSTHIPIQHLLHHDPLQRPPRKVLLHHEEGRHEAHSAQLWLIGANADHADNVPWWGGGFDERNDCTAAHLSKQ